MTLRLPGLSPLRTSESLLLLFYSTVARGRFRGSLPNLTSLQTTPEVGTELYDRTATFSPSIFWVFSIILISISIMKAPPSRRPPQISSHARHKHNRVPLRVWRRQAFSWLLKTRNCCPVKGHWWQTASESASKLDVPALPWPHNSFALSFDQVRHN